ncbi:MAG: M28 family peptidase [Bdellovibrionales bacterium]|nr:M28 family peptidase [Bdellovibrionales bacterium]
MLWRILVKICILLLFSNIGLANSNVKKVVNKYKKDELLKELRGFVQCCRPNRLVGSSGHSLATPFLINRIKEITKGDESTLVVQEFVPDLNEAIKSYKSDFKNNIASKYSSDSKEYLKWKKFTDEIVNFLKSLKGVKGKNLIWEKKGSQNKTLIIGAHIDTVVQNEDFSIDDNAEMPGADDNASGVSILLGMIKVLSQLELKRNLKIIFFDFQEFGQLGSKAYIDEYYSDLSQNIELEGFVNLLMLGHDSKSKNENRGDFRAYIRKENKQDKNLATQLIQLGKASTRSVKFEIAANETIHSDQLRFWEKGIAAVVFSQNWENDYNKDRHHTSNDFPETLNFNTLHKSYLYLTTAIVKWALDIDK